MQAQKSMVSRTSPKLDIAKGRGAEVHILECIVHGLRRAIQEGMEGAL